MLWSIANKVDLTNPKFFKTSSFHDVTVGNRFFHKNEFFIKINQDKAIGEDHNFIDFNKSQYVTIDAI